MSKTNGYEVKPGCTLLTMRGIEELSAKVSYYLETWKTLDLIDSVGIDCPRFSSGEAKGIVCQSVRGKDLFVLIDPFNYSITYRMNGIVNHMSPDDHFQDLKRILSAVGGKAKRITVIMPMLYEGRQHRRQSRESLDCAHALQELSAMGVSNIVTFDAHDSRVQNAVPLLGFDDMSPRYQMLKAFVKVYGKDFFTNNKIIFITPDEGAFARANSYSSSLGVDIGMFFKKRNLERVVEGENPISMHFFIGHDVEGKSAFVVDDILSVGTSVLKVFHSLHDMHADKIFGFITFGLFSEGPEAFDEAYAKGVFDKIFVTNLIYIPDSIKSKPWIHVVDMSKYVAYVISAIHDNHSISDIIDPDEKIELLLQ